MLGPSWRAVSRPLAATVLALALAGCGGGGGGERDLEVYFSYGSDAGTARVNMFSTPELLTIQGLGEHTPQCMLVSGTLPTGVSLASDCRFQGLAQSAGVFTGTVRLTVPGFRGEVQATYSFAVQALSLTVTDRLHLLQLTAGAPLIARPADAAVAILSGYFPQPGDEAALAVTQGVLPEGVSLLEENGFIGLAGNASVVGRFEVDLVFSLRRAGLVTSSAPLRIVLNVDQPALQVDYRGCCMAALGVPMSFVPVTNFVASAGGSLRHEVIGALPPGLELNSQTGELRGIPQEEETYLSSVTVRSILQTPLGTTYVDGNLYVTVLGVYGLYPVSSQGRNALYSAGSNPPLQIEHRVDAGVPFVVEPGSLFGQREGDVYRFALAPNRYYGMPVADWVQIDPLTGVISGLKPGPTHFAQFEVHITLTRGGVDYLAKQFWLVN